MANKREQERRQIRYTNAADVVKDQIESQSFGGDLRIPEGWTFLKVDTTGDYNLDIIPYIVGKNARLVGRNVQPGDVHYEFSYEQHAKVGPNEESVACLTNWGKKCPLCERAAAFKRTMRPTEEDQDTLGLMRAKLRTVMIVIDRDARGEQKPQLFAYSWHGFAKQLAGKLTNSRAEEMGYLNFFHLAGGRTVYANMQPLNKKSKWLVPATMELIPRKEDLDESLLEQMPSLDEMLIERNYDEIVAIADGVPYKKDEPGNGRPPSGVNDNRQVRVSSSVSGPHLDSREEGRPIQRNPRDNGERSQPEGRSTRRDRDPEPEKTPEITKGDYVMYKDKRCKVVFLAKNGETADVEDEKTGKLYEDVKVGELKLGVPANDDDQTPSHRQGREEPDPDAPRSQGRSRSQGDEPSDGRQQRGSRWGDDDKDEPSGQEPAKEERPARGGRGGRSRD